MSPGAPQRGVVDLTEAISSTVVRAPHLVADGLAKGRVEVAGPQRVPHVLPLVYLLNQLVHHVGGSSTMNSLAMVLRVQLTTEAVLERLGVDSLPQLIVMHDPRSANSGSEHNGSSLRMGWAKSTC